MPKCRHLRALYDVLEKSLALQERNTFWSNRKDAIYPQNDPLNTELNPRPTLVPLNSKLKE